MAEKEYGYREVYYRGFAISSDHEGEDGEVTGYTAVVSSERASKRVGEDVGSMMGGFKTVREAKDFVDNELYGT